MLAAVSLPSSLHPLPSSFLGQKLTFNNTTTASPPASAYVRSCPPRVAATYTSAESTRTKPNLNSSSNIMGMVDSSASLYELLGIPMGATFEEIKSAYRKLARVCHPDVVANGRKDTSANEFIKIHSAYTTLSDPEKRADYDRNLFTRQRLYRSPSSSASAYASAASSSMSEFSGKSRRTWETDQCW